MEQTGGLTVKAVILLKATAQAHLFGHRDDYVAIVTRGASAAGSTSRVIPQGPLPSLSVSQSNPSSRRVGIEFVEFAGCAQVRSRFFSSNYGRWV
jgi:hypothetical protein